MVPIAMDSLWLPGVAQEMMLFIPVFLTVPLTGELGATTLQLALVMTLWSLSMQATLPLPSLTAIIEFLFMAFLGVPLTTPELCSPMASLATWFLPPSRVLWVVRQLLPLDKLFLVCVMVTPRVTLLCSLFL